MARWERSARAGCCSMTDVSMIDGVSKAVRVGQSFAAFAPASRLMLANLDINAVTFSLRLHLPSGALLVVVLGWACSAVV
eukprot:6487433-Amphidinium_carterae.1